jgi:hypothetical protein
MGMPVFADHMTFDDFLVAPLLRVHDSATTLLLVQALAVASACSPIHALAVRILARPRVGLGLAVAWALAPDVHMGVMFDYNQTPFASRAAAVAGLGARGTGAGGRPRHDGARGAARRATSVSTPPCSRSCWRRVSVLDDEPPRWQPLCFRLSCWRLPSSSPGSARAASGTGSSRSSATGPREIALSM